MPGTLQKRWQRRVALVVQRIENLLGEKNMHYLPGFAAIKKKQLRRRGRVITSDARAGCANRLRQLAFRYGRKKTRDRGRFRQSARIFFAFQTTTRKKSATFRSRTSGFSWTGAATDQARARSRAMANDSMSSLLLVSVTHASNTFSIPGKSPPSATPARIR